jgi:hypothetical protein
VIGRLLEQVGESLPVQPAGELVDEDPAAVGPRRPGREPLAGQPCGVAAQGADGVRGQRDRPPAAPLGLLGDDLVVGVGGALGVDLQPAALEVHVGPGQPGELAAAHAGRQREQPAGLNPIAGRGGEGADACSGVDTVRTGRRRFGTAASSAGFLASRPHSTASLRAFAEDVVHQPDGGVRQQPAAAAARPQQVGVQRRQG